ncbi:MAG: DNA-binding protein [Prevotella sp.]|nr:DNA-binding protein [Prevotella sp.]
MAKDLTTSQIERQNVLNNKVALPRIQESLGIKALEYQGVLYVTKQMAADFYEVDLRTIENCLANNERELQHNGYRLWKGNDLKDFKLHFAPEIDFGSKTTQLGLFDFRSFLNIGMLLTTSEKAKQVRSKILDIVIATINEKTGGGTKYINRRDREYLPAAIQEENYHKNLTEAVSKYVDGHRTYKYAQVMDLIYKAVFCEKAKEYRQLLELSEKDNVRRTLYAEVLRVVSSFENGVAYEISRMAKEKGVLKVADVAEICKQLAEHPLQTPYIYDARQKMASRDLAFRDVFHGNIAEYLKAVTPEEFDKFIGSKSIDFDEIMALPENKEVLRILKQAENDRD